MSSKPDSIDQLKQWGIKSISSRVIDEITREVAQIEASTGQKLTNGQMIEKLWEHWKTGGTLQLQQQPVSPVDDLVKLIEAGGPWGEKNPLPGEVRRLMNASARARLTSLQPGMTEAPKRLTNGFTVPTELPAKDPPSA